MPGSQSEVRRLLPKRPSSVSAMSRKDPRRSIAVPITASELRILRRVRAASRGRSLSDAVRRAVEFGAGTGRQSTAVEHPRMVLMVQLPKPTLMRVLAEASARGQPPVQVLRNDMAAGLKQLALEDE